MDPKNQASENKWQEVMFDHPARLDINGTWWTSQVGVWINLMYNAFARQWLANPIDEFYHTFIWSDIQEQLWGKGVTPPSPFALRSDSREERDVRRK